VRVDRTRPRRYPWWQLILIGLVGLFEALFRPIARMWRSEDPLDTYGLAHLGSVAGDAMVAVALAGSVFFDIPVGEATSEVALYLVLTMVPLAIAGPFLVPLLDRAGPRRAISFGAALGRAVVCLYAAPRFGTLLLFPCALVLLVLAKVHGITRNGSRWRTPVRTKAWCARTPAWGASAWGARSSARRRLLRSWSSAARRPCCTGRARPTRSPRC
jgi:hypothetical protein